MPALDLTPVWVALEAAPLSAAIRRDASLFPWIESVHVLAVVIVVGAVFVMDMRLLGIAGRGRTLDRVVSEGVICVWGAFVVAMISGFLLFASSATIYAANPAFQLKFLAMAAAGANMVLFHAVGLRRAVSADEVGASPLPARVAGAVSVLCWVVVVAAGRWIGFV